MLGAATLDVFSGSSTFCGVTMTFGVLLKLTVSRQWFVVKGIERRTSSTSLA
jgi:hypothetical protein